MPTVSENRLLRHSPEVLYALVRDVASYPAFLPWCVGAMVHDQTEAMQQATLQIGKGVLRHAFTTHNVCVPHQSIHMYLVSGPLKYLKGAWLFEPVATGTQVSFNLDFDFDLPVVRSAMNRFLARATSHMVTAFEQRAEAICDD